MEALRVTPHHVAARIICQEELNSTAIEAAARNELKGSSIAVSFLPEPICLHALGQKRAV